jgi:hypothetical protein
MNKALKMRTVKNILTNSASINLTRGTQISGVSELAFYVEEMGFNKGRIFGEESVGK